MKKKESIKEELGKIVGGYYLIKNELSWVCRTSEDIKHLSDLKKKKKILGVKVEDGNEKGGYEYFCTFIRGAPENHREDGPARKINCLSYDLNFSLNLFTSWNLFGKTIAWADGK